MSSLITDFNVSPYFDDYDEDKRYSRILYRPAVAVQARELTQSQTILQAQIQRFGDHIFKDGSVVDGVGIVYYSNVHYISLEDTFSNDPNRVISTLANNNYLVTNMNGSQSSNAVRAVIKLAIDGNKTAAPYTNRLYFDYISTGTNTSSGADIDRFANGDTLYIYSADQSKLGVLDDNNLIDYISTITSNASFTTDGYAYCVAVTDGTIYQKGFFSKVPAQVIAVGNTLSTNVDGYAIGFDTIETIVTENQDTSLNDNALGYDNENAPGAHRLKLTPTLVSKTITDTTNNTNFFSIVQFDQNKPVQQKTDPQYSEIQTEIARSTYEESGDYTIRPFKLDTRPVNSDKFDYELSSGTAYVRGYRVDIINSKLIEADRAKTTNTASSQIITANYGNYVICNEYTGAFNEEQLVSVNLYDVEQKSITTIAGKDASAPAVNNLIGTANIRAVVYAGGDKGTSEAQYYVYLFNIKMSSGKSFSNVKSIYSTGGGFGNVKADIILENGVAKLQNSKASSLVFDTGIKAVANATNSSYTYKQIQSGSVLAGGTVIISLEPDAPGSSAETLTESVGTYSTSSVTSKYDIFTNNSIFTTNLSGTLSVTSGSGIITGSSGTNFLNDFEVGSLLRYSNGTTVDNILKVTSIAGASSMTVVPTPPATNTAVSAYQRYFISGMSLPISSIQVNTSRQFTANIGYSFGSSNSINASYPVSRPQAVAISKTINKSTAVKIQCSNNAATSVGPWDLGVTDVLKIKNIYVGTSFTGIESTIDRSDWFILDNGQRDETYEHSRLYVKPEYASNITSSTYILIRFDNFIANTAAGVGFFSIESYPVDDAPLTGASNTAAIQTIDIPVYNGIDLRSAIDVRVVATNTAITTSDAAAATINPATSNSFSIYSGGQHTIVPDTNFQADFKYYLPRYDLITLNSNGDAAVQKGIPSLAPTTPRLENDQTAVAEVYVPGYPSITQKEAEDYNRFDSTIKINMKSNRRYTMKDIGALEERIKRIEYYTVLSALEQQAKDLTIPDANGLNRFKNGIFADPFNSYKNGNIEDLEFKISIDPVNTVGRPFFKQTPFDYKLISANSTNIKQQGSYALLNYTDEKFVRQQYSTKYRVCSESVWSWNGLVSLYPSIDAFKDTTVLPPRIIDLDLASDAVAKAANTPPTYGGWRTTDVKRQSRDTGNRIITTTTTTQQQIVTNMVVDTETTSINLGPNVTDISINPYMRSRIVAFIARNMKPNTILHAFFDNTNVDSHCAPGTINAGSADSYAALGNPAAIVAQNGAWGAALTSNSSGGVAGVFRIPAQTFRTGDRLFQLSNVSDLTTGASAILTSSKANYSASSLSVTKQSSTLTVEEPIIRYEQSIQTRSSTQVQITDDSDPIAQSFTISGLPSNVTGIMLTKVGVYFQSKDPTLGVTLLVCEMLNGQPNSKKILGKARLSSAEVSANPTTPNNETVFTLDYPVFLLNNSDYAFMVCPDGNSPDYTVWVGETGGTDILTGAQVYSNPYSGMLFVSANKTTWTSIQKEDMMFNLYRAKFVSNSGTVIFDNSDNEFITYSGANIASPITIGDVVYTVNIYSNGVFNTANTTTGAAFGVVTDINRTNSTIYLESATGGFSNTLSAYNSRFGVFRVPDNSLNAGGGLANVAQINATSFIATANIATIDNFTYHAISPAFGTLQPATTNISYGYKGVIGSTKDSDFTVLDNGYEYEFLDSPRVFKSKSNESGVKSSTFQINLTSETNYSSPVINLGRKSATVIENIINNDTTVEHTKYGNSSSKYISKTVVLADGQDAEDLKVYVTGYRPYETDIKVYAKFLNAQDSEDFDSKYWTLLNYANNTDLKYSSSTNVTDYIEYEYVMPTVSPYVSVTGTLTNNSPNITAVSSVNNIYVGQILTSNVTNGIVRGSTVVSTNASTNTIVMNINAANTSSASAAQINANPTTAFSNSGVITTTALAGSVNVASNSTSIVGNGTAFSSDFVVGDTIKIASNSSYYAYRTVTSITNATAMTVDKALPSVNNASLYYTYISSGNDGIVEYQNSAGSRFNGYKNFAIKIVLLSSNAVKVPRLQDVRAIALQI